MRRMVMMAATFWDDHLWLGAAMVSGVIVLVSSVADRKRNRRTNIEDVGFMPWTAITVFSVLATVIAAALAIKGV
jgi:hypothetical protein